MLRHRSAVLGLTALAAALTACDTNPSQPFGATATMQFINGASSGSVNVLVDGSQVLSNVPSGALSQALIPVGSHAVVVQKVGGAMSVAATASFTAHRGLIVVALDSSGALNPRVLADTGSIVPAGATKLRVAHLAKNATPISVWRTQPDFGTAIRIQFPFHYQDVSPYLQSTPGSWNVMISSEVLASGSPPMPDTLALTGLVAVADGFSKTVVVLDGPAAGTVKLIVVDP